MKYLCGNQNLRRVRAARRVDLHAIDDGLLDFHPLVKYSEVELVVAVPARAPDLDAARVVGADLAVGALIGGRRVGRRVRPKRRERGRVLRRAAERVQDDGEEAGSTLRVFRVLPAELRRKVVWS